VTITEKALAIADDFSSLVGNEKLELLIEISEKLPPLPERYVDHPDLMERVEECQSPVYLFVEVNEGLVNVFLTAPREAPTTRAFAGILHSALDGESVETVLNFDDDYPSMLGITELVSPLRMRGIRGMLARIKRQVSEKIR
jgi:cysteine desulfuration protein SufE